MVYNAIGCGLGLAWSPAPVPAASLEVSLNPDGTLAFQADRTQPLQITISVPTQFSGIYDVTLQGLSEGPINLVPPVILSGEIQTLPFRPLGGLWLYDMTLGPLVGTFEWALNGTVQPQLQFNAFQGAPSGGVLSLSETLTQGDDLSKTASHSVTLVA